MKKTILILFAFINILTLSAQTEFDALKYIQTDITGTARYMSMSGAFGALGGDASSIKDNPAGLGVYRSSEVVGSLNTTIQSSTSFWNNIGSKITSPYKTGFNNFALIIAVPTWRQETGAAGLISSNFSFSYNRLKNYDKMVRIKSENTSSSMTQYMAYFTDKIPLVDLKYTDSYEPFDNVNIPWISILGYEAGIMNEQKDGSGNTVSWNSFLGTNETVKPSYLLTEKGHIDEYQIGWSGNYNNKLFFGATANIQTLNYSAISKYGESFSEGGSIELVDTVLTKGNGLNFNLGAIYHYSNNLRFGLSIQTPTILSLSDDYYSKINFDTDINSNVGTPGSYSDFMLQSPLRVNVSTAYIFEKAGLVSFEYNFSNNQGIQLMDSYGNNQSFDLENEGMIHVAKNVHTFKFGGEYKVSPNFSLRAGYANVSRGTKSTANKYMRINTTRTDTEYFINNSTNYYSAGFGYREAKWFIDFAYVHRILDETFLPYNLSNVNTASIKTSTDNLAVTLGFKF